MKEKQNTNPFTEPFYLTDGGLESTMVFHHGIELNHFAAFELLNDKAGRKELRTYFMPYFDLAVKYNVPFVAETPTWRTNPDWVYKLGYSTEQLHAISRHAVDFFRQLADEHSITQENILISGCLGPRGDGYVVEKEMTPVEAKSYHSEQIKAFALADADVVTSFTLNYLEEALGIAQAAKGFAIPVVIGFTVETDGNLPSGQPLREAIEAIDSETEAYPVHYMINCAHPEHFKHIFGDNRDWVNRIGCIRANASLKSHAELDNSTTLDTGDKCLLASGYHELKHLLPNLKVVGGCCGTDHSHIAKICEVLVHDDPELCLEEG